MSSSMRIKYLKNRDAEDALAHEEETVLIPLI